MAISVYAGLMGSGKSYEVVKSVIVPALASGRRVVSNIAGLNKIEIDKYIVKVHKIEAATIGELVVVKNDDVVGSAFFPDEKYPDATSIVQGGDLVAIDEVWQFWGTGYKVGPNAMQFFRMHRHYVHLTTHLTCDIVLMIQDLSTLHRVIRAVIEMTFIMTKLKALGLNNRYRVELYEGHKISKAFRYDYYVNSYDKQIFPLYQSYVSGVGAEKRTDKRQNMLMNRRLWFIAVGMVVATALGWHFTMKFFRGTPPKKGSPAGKSSKLTRAPADGVVALPVTPLSKAYRVSGGYSANGDTWVVLVDNDGRIRVESPSQFSGKGLAAAGIIDGERVTTFSGSARQATVTEKAGVAK